MAGEIITLRQSVTDAAAFPPRTAGMAKLEQAGIIK
jgi:hypothetical protein